MTENLRDASVLHDTVTVKSDMPVRRWCELRLSCCEPVCACICRERIRWKRACAHRTPAPVFYFVPR